ncbi:hypothetical protein PQR64_36130 [Paraburkholderia phytofirmans]|uniref:hypothetical protein n=1 Tax=Paraburkholderia phytofirmans TaxID=261302 RepID=UPI0038BDE9FB
MNLIGQSAQTFNDGWARLMRSFLVAQYCVDKEIICRIHHVATSAANPKMDRSKVNRDPKTNRCPTRPPGAPLIAVTTKRLPGA